MYSNAGPRLRPGSLYPGPDPDLDPNPDPEPAFYKKVSLRNPLLRVPHFAKLLVHLVEGLCHGILCHCRPLYHECAYAALFLMFLCPVASLRATVVHCG